MSYTGLNFVDSAPCTFLRVESVSLFEIGAKLCLFELDWSLAFVI